MHLLGTKGLEGKELTGLLDIPLVPFSIRVQAHALGMTFLLPLVIMSTLNRC